MIWKLIAPLISPKLGYTPMLLTQTLRFYCLVMP
nr:MAG TPA: hypothetical protein [Caudoviricetes sp.]